MALQLGLRREFWALKLRLIDGSIDRSISDRSASLDQESRALLNRFNRDRGPRIPNEMTEIPRDVRSPTLKCQSTASPEDWRAFVAGANLARANSDVIKVRGEVAAKAGKRAEVHHRRRGAGAMTAPRLKHVTDV